jgi:hypothetical protein
MYESNITSAPPNSPFVDFNVPHTQNDYESLTYQSSTPHIPASYNQGIVNNAETMARNMHYNLPAMPPEPLPSYIDLPTFTPPYGTPYQTPGYSAYDGEVAMNMAVPAYYSHPGVPASTWPALQDARDSPSMPMTPYALEMVVKNHYKEGYKNGREHFAQTYTPSCSDCINHIQGCPLCSSFVNGHKQLYQFGIGFLIILVCVLLYMLFKKHHMKAPGGA